MTKKYAIKVVTLTVGHPVDINYRASVSYPTTSVSRLSNSVQDVVSKALLLPLPGNLSTSYHEFMMPVTP